MKGFSLEELIIYTICMKELQELHPAENLAFFFASRGVQIHDTSF